MVLPMVCSRGDLGGSHPMVLNMRGIACDPISGKPGLCGHAYGSGRLGHHGFRMRRFFILDRNSGQIIGRAEHERNDRGQLHATWWRGVGRRWRGLRLQSNHCEHHDRLQNLSLGDPPTPTMPASTCRRSSAFTNTLTPSGPVG